MRDFSVPIWCVATVLIITPCIIQPTIEICKKKARDNQTASIRRARTRNTTRDLHDFNTAGSALQREFMFSRYHAFVTRIQYIASQIAIGLIFYSFSYSVLTRNIGTENAYIFNIVFHVIQFISIQTFLKISLSDPGIISNKGNYKRNYKHSFEPIVIDPDNAPASFCWRCKFVRPIRSKHDYDIDACVAVFDHYSPTMGNAIGAYNHRYFILLKTLDIIVYIICIYIIIDLFIYNIINEYSSILGWIIIVLTLLYILYSLHPTVVILIYHLYLATTNQTTYEIVKPQINQKTKEFLEELRSNNAQHRESRIGRYYDSNNFDEGYLRNLILFLKGYEEKIECFYGFRCEIGSSDGSGRSFDLDLNDSD